jgi:hypothetical protein
MTTWPFAVTVALSIQLSPILVLPSAEPMLLAVIDSFAVLPAHFLEETGFFELVDEARLDETFRIGVG